jgi:2-polyprenyl-3-methyl-5-hydroxy-6-metoxy-1,4-benzoquinol methylase
VSTGLNEFYGSDSQLRVYHARFMRYLDQAPPTLPVLDLGCGSGVFLELVRERGRHARGVEPAAEAVDLCRHKELDVVQADALHFLETQPPEAYSAIYCAHLIEHLAYPDACRLLELATRALAPQGRLIVITPNPVSLGVIAETFWLDPTHVRPYPLPLLQKMMTRAEFDVIAAGHDNPPGVPRRTLPRRVWLRLILGKHYGAVNTFVIGVRRKNA